jgi:DNA-binding NarL/FixJ family response regulator
VTGIAAIISLRLGGRAPAVQRPVAPLSEREIEVVQAIAKGRTNTEIAGWAWETGLVQPASS